MNELIVTGVAKSFGTTAALRGVDLVVPQGSITAVLGPSGCGKTTLLRIVAGFERPDRGTVTLGDTVVVGPKTWVAPQRRDIGYVAQEGALFPHLTVGRNVAFGLPRGSADRVAELLELVSLDASYAKRYPHQLSGGQQQRVALARALARQPKLILLDEPFTALDAGLRAATRTAVAEALAVTGVTTVLVTHDQGEALSFADQVAVMHDGAFSQVGPPRAVYAEPADLRTAQFVGDAVLLPGEVNGGVVRTSLGVLPLRHAHPDGTATVLLRPEQIVLEPVADGEQADGHIAGCTYYGHDAAVTVSLAGLDHPLVTTRQAGTNLGDVGAPIRMRIVGDALAYPADGTAAAALEKVSKL